MERLRTWKQAAHHDTHCKRVLAPILPTCAAQGLRPHPPLRLSRQRTPSYSHRASSPAACLSDSSNFASHQLFAGCLALPALRSQHEHRSQPHRATAGISMSRHFVTPTPSNGPRRYDPMSRGTRVFRANLRTPHLFLLACSSRNRSLLRYLSSSTSHPTRPSSLFALSMQANSRN